MAGEFLRLLQNRQLATAFANGDFLTDADLVRWNVDLAAIHLHVTMAHELPRLAAGNPEAKPVNYVVETALELLQKHRAGDTASARSFFEVVAELRFLGEINSFSFLLLAQLQSVAYNFGLAVLAMLPRSKVALLNGTFVAEAFCAFEEQLHALTAAKTTDRISVTGQFSSPLDDRFTGLASPFIPGR